MVEQKNVESKFYEANDPKISPEDEDMLRTCLAMASFLKGLELPVPDTFAVLHDIVSEKLK